MYPIGLYIEPKMYNFYLDHYGVDASQLLYDVLKKFDLHNIKSCQDKLPIIIESFENGSLKKFGKLSDLPLIQLVDHK